MALITRISRLFRADLNAVLDRVEEPEMLLRQSIREMEDHLSADEQKSRVMQHESDRLEVRLSEIDAKLLRLDEELDLCFSTDNEDLARSLVKRKLVNELQAKQTKQQQATNRDSLERLKRRLHENRSRLESMHQKAELFAGEERREVSPGPWSEDSFAVQEADIELAFLREQQKRLPS